MNFYEQFRATWLTSLIGCALFIIGTLILFWNEGQAVHITLALQEALDQAISLRYDQSFDSSFEGKLVHIYGPLVTGEPLTELDYNIMVQAVKLKRRVQMFQYVEETIEHNYGESVASVQAEDRTYYYTTEFRDNLVDSRSFYLRHGHENPLKFPMESRLYTADHVTIGPYELGSELKDRFTAFQEVTSDTRPEDPLIKLHAGLYYHCVDVFNPEVGDIRIQFSFAGLQGEVYTVVGRLENNKIVPFKSKLGKKILILYKGEFDLHDVFDKEHRSQKLTAWGFRFIGFVLIFFAVTCTSHLLTTILSSNWFTAHLAPNPANVFASNLGFSLSTALLITSVAWILHRPWLGASLLCTAITPVLFRRQAVRYQRMD
uniref:CSON013011 protein n=1 Tax=Culicoides sonorensis TaxID=179676 RepID=A0A336LMM0_CULSO